MSVCVRCRVDTRETTASFPGTSSPTSRPHLVCAHPRRSQPGQPHTLAVRAPLGATRKKGKPQRRVFVRLPACHAPWPSPRLGRAGGGCQLRCRRIHRGRSPAKTTTWGSDSLFAPARFCGGLFAALLAGGVCSYSKVRRRRHVLYLP